MSSKARPRVQVTTNGMDADGRLATAEGAALSKPEQPFSRLEQLEAENEALMARFGAGIPIDWSQYYLVIVCKHCGEFARPTMHACRARLNETQPRDR